MSDRGLSLRAEQKLAAKAAKLERASQAVERARAELEQAVAEAAAGGATIRAIGAVIGRSHTRVAQMLNRARNPEQEDA